jgi:hypothetical protein
MMNNALRLGEIVIIGFLLWGQAVPAEDLPLTENVPISEFQNRIEDAKTYDFDAPPQGMFRSIVLAEDFEERLGFQRTLEIVPIKPTERFPADDSGYLKLSAPQGGWMPGRYKVEIHVGEQINETSLMGTMRFTIVTSRKQPD